MSAPVTTRRDLLRLGTSAAAYAAGAAIVTGGVALASEAKGSTGISPALLALIAEANRLQAYASTFGLEVYDPARDYLVAADASIPHIEVAGYQGATWSTDDERRVANARMWIRHDRKLISDDQREHFAAMQRLIAAHDERKARVDQAGNRAAFDRIHEQDDENGSRSANAMDEVANFPAANLADLRVKLAYMVKHEMGDGMDWLPEVLADVQRLAGVVA